jgi:DNA-directed RNA polymerase subunit H (RpoH/RPB5)
MTNHVLKPKHQVLTAEEKAKLLKQYNVVDSQVLPLDVFNRRGPYHISEGC